MIRARSNRGGMILGFAALTFVLGVMCSIVLLTSLDSYRASALAAQRIQARAAAEGAAVLAAEQGNAAFQQPLKLGECTITSEAAGRDGATSIPLLVAVHPNGSERASLVMRYALAPADSGTTASKPRLELQL